MILLLLKRFWPYLAVAFALLALWAWHKGEVKDAYNEGVAVTEDAQAEVIAHRMYENEKREHELALTIAKLTNQLEVKTSETNTLSTELMSVARTSRLCLANKVRSSTPSEDPRPTSTSDGASVSNGLPETLGEAITELFAQCDHNTNKLITLQSERRELKAKGF
jgi:hypothetical protein